MSYQVLARKWRPKNFHELVGQDHVRKALVSALDNDRLHHAYLFTGTRGVGKTTIARIIAKCLNCETGVTSRPCGTCSSCREIDEGRFVDLIEVDAASRTKVEDTRELLDNVQYAPSRGRYKVYLIDEVHMLSTHSFNALLKTLEEPPPHVKFLLATTDPQKLPVTVLSRCLQFNLKNMPPERVVEHLNNVLTQEQIPYEEAALWQLGRAADGSMRDALSLTDQAIAYGQGQISAAQVSEMLGLVDHRHVASLIEHLISRDARALLAEVVQLSEQAADFETILSDMALYLHRMAVAQVLPDAVDNAQGDREQVLAQAARLAAEDVQLYYQIAIKSQEDLPLAPDARTGFEMALIRMVAFAPQGVPSQGGNPLPSQAAPMPVQSVPVSNHTASESGPSDAELAPAETAASEVYAPSISDDEAKKKALTAAEPAASEEVSPPISADAPQPERVRFTVPSREPQTAEVSVSTESSSAAAGVNEAATVAGELPSAAVESAIPQASLSPDSRTAELTSDAESQPIVEDAPVAHTVQNARAALAGGLRTVNFPGAMAQRAAQAESAVESSAQPERGSPAAPYSAQPATVPVATNPNDIPPWEELPVIPEPVEDVPSAATQESPSAVSAPEIMLPSPPPQSVVVADEATTPELEVDVTGYGYDERMPPPFSDEGFTAMPVAEDYLSETDSYAHLMPEPVSEAPKPVPVLRDSQLPESEDVVITPMVGVLPPQLTCNQEWLEAFAHLPLRGFDRSLARNAALVSRDGDHLKFALKVVTDNFLTPERQASWQQSVRALYGDNLTIEIVAFSTDLDTPEDYEMALKHKRQQQAEALFAQDPVIQGLRSGFGAEIDTASIEPLI